MRLVDLHCHSNASDGDAEPGEVVRAAAAAGLSAIALTDHDTLEGVGPGLDCDAASKLRVVAGCEFSVAASWGELHLLGYFLPHEDPQLRAFLKIQRRKRVRRAGAIVERLKSLNVDADTDSVLAEAQGASVGRPHVARALVKSGAVRDLNEAFDRYLADGRPAYVAKDLPSLSEVVTLVRNVGGVTSAAHLGSRATDRSLAELKQAGVDGVEVLHPAHDDRTIQRVRAFARSMNMLPTGGSDWHGESSAQRNRGGLGRLQVPYVWLEAIESLHRERVAVGA